MSPHLSVLLKESIEGLEIKEAGIYVDGTFGRGGHSRAILEKLNAAGRLIAIDKDLDAIRFAEEHFTSDPRFSIVHGSFAALPQIAKDFNIAGKINGILLDLGVSSPQLDSPNRGFSFLKSGPLDMRMDLSKDLDAAHFIHHASAKELECIFKDYGEERYARRIAHAIVEARAKDAIITTDALAMIVKEAHPKWEKHKHPATRVFQAIRIHINQELKDLKNFLQHCLSLMAVGGRLVIISFHSLEDRLVKQFMRDEEQGQGLPKGVPQKASEIKRCFKRIGKAIKASQVEVNHNLRARSAVLRIGEKIA